MLLALASVLVGSLHSDSKFGVDGIAPDFQWYRQYNGDYSYPPSGSKKKFWTFGKIDANPLVAWSGTFSAGLSHYLSIFDAEKPYLRDLVDAARNAGESEIHITIGNEPNVYPYVQPSDYAAVFKTYYDYIKGTDAEQLNCSQCVVHNGAILLVRMMPSNTSLASLLINLSGQNLKDYQAWSTEFFSNLSALGGHVDAINVHLYDANLEVVSISGAGIANDLLAAALGRWRTDPLAAYPQFLQIAQLAGYADQPVWVDEFGVMDNSATTATKISSMNRMVGYFQTRPELKRWFWYKNAGTDEKLSGTSPFLKALGIKTAMDPTQTGLYDSDSPTATRTPLGDAYLALRMKYEGGQILSHFDLLLE